MNNLSASDWIQILGIISSFTLSAVALWVSHKSNKIAEKSTLISKQASLDNNRMIEETLRPELVLYPETYLNSNVNLVLVLKNIGSTSCVIDELYSDFDFLKNDFYIIPNTDPLKSLVGLTLGPNQSKLIHLKGENIPKEKINFTYSYHNSTKAYVGQQVIDFNSGKELATRLGSTKGQELKYIYHTLLETFWKSI